MLSKLKQGNTICDPTAGDGKFIHALVQQYVDAEGSISISMLKKLYLIEKESYFLNQFRESFFDSFGINFPESNIFNTDIIQNNPDLQFDCIVGNPPWANFTDLEDSLKEELKPFFVSIGLVKNLKNVLLGGSRIDIAALILYTVFAKNTKSGSKCGFFLPISLFLNDGASDSFRNYRVGNTDFSLDKIHDFGDLEVFKGVGTRFCFATFTISQKSKYPIDYYIQSNNVWIKQFAAPIGSTNSPLIIKPDNLASSFYIKKIDLDFWQQPRQGINTCGANDVFIVEKYPEYINPDFVYPLVTTKLLQGKVSTPEKFIILPYHKNGKPLSLNELKNANLFEYFLLHQDRLKNRKGVLINSVIKKGFWWALIGIGPYSFSPIKIIWASFGSKNFSPKILSTWQKQEWQANQAMQAFIPANNFHDAERIRDDFYSLGIENHLKDQKMEGTMNWAQPGRIKRFLNIKQTKQELLFA